MKRFRIILLVVPLFFAGCGQINEEIESLKTRIDNLEGTTIASIEQQISSINKSLGDLSGMDMSLKAYLNVLSSCVPSYSRLRFRSRSCKRRQARGRHERQQHRDAEQYAQQFFHRFFHNFSPYSYFSAQARGHCE